MERSSVVPAKAGTQRCTRGTFNVSRHLWSPVIACGNDKLFMTGIEREISSGPSHSNFLFLPAICQRWPRCQCALGGSPRLCLALCPRRQPARHHLKIEVWRPTRATLNTSRDGVRPGSGWGARHQPRWTQTPQRHRKSLQRGELPETGMRHARGLVQRSPKSSLFTHCQSLDVSIVVYRIDFECSYEQP